MKILVMENERGLLFKNGRFVKMLTPGKYTYVGKAYQVETVATKNMFSTSYDLEVFLSDPQLKNELEIVEVADETIALHYTDGRFRSALPRGKYAFWKITSKHEFKHISLKEPLVDASISPYIFNSIMPNLFQRVEVQSFQKGLLYYNGEFKRLLEPGIYFFWNNGVKVNVILTDSRLLQMYIQGQEILTADKVTLRVNFICRYKITDHVKIVNEIDDYEEQIRVMTQLALREYVGRLKLDEILENKEQIADFVLNKLKEKEQESFVSFFDAGVKDIILPGEIRDIMNTVLIAEKRAQANVITRREEVASTRSLLNTAKLMEENQTLMRLKEMEYLEKICAGVGNITVNGGSDLLGQLAELIGRK